MISKIKNYKKWLDYFEQDPWTGRPKGPSLKQSIQHLSKYLKKILTDLGLYPALLYIKKWSGNKPNKSFTPKNILFSILTNLIFVWIIFGFVVLKPDTEGLVTRLGQYQRTIGPGVHWHMRFIEKVTPIDILQPKQHVQTLSTFTKDGQLINGTLELYYQINNSRQFAFNAIQPIEQLRQMAITQFVDEIKAYTLSELLSKQTVDTIQKKLQHNLQTAIIRHPLGLQLITVSTPKVRAPIEIQKQFEAIRNAQQEVTQLEQEAEMVKEQIKAKTEQEVEQLYANANIRKHEIVMKAKSDISQFLALLPSYEEDPQLTTQRLYFDKIEKILKKTPKAFVIQPNAMGAHHNTPLQIPIDQLFSKLTAKPLSKTRSPAATHSPSTASQSG